MIPLHPSVVHFPVALLIAAGICYVAHLFVKQYRLDVVGFFLHAGGLLGCVAAILTGDYTESNIVQNEQIHSLAERHEQMGMIATYAFGILGVWAYLRQQSNIFAERIVFTVVFVGVIGLLGYGSHLGGRMVYEEGAGVIPMQPIIEQQRDASSPTDATLNNLPNGYDNDENE
ncbi:MAG: DUF2231 domain-containing protein [Bacteroidota bacterium]